MPRFVSADSATLATQDLIKELQNKVPEAPLSTLNDTHQTALHSLTEIFNIITKDAEKKSTNRYNGLSSGTKEIVT